jgi:hypothetical protein
VFDGELVLLLVMFINFSPIAADVAFEKGTGTVARSCKTARAPGVATMAERKTRQRHCCPRNPASLAVARNCGIGSSSLNAEFLMARVEVQVMDRPGQMLGHIQVGFDERPEC